MFFKNALVISLYENKALVPDEKMFGELAESVEGARLLSEYAGYNLYRGFESLALRQVKSPARKLGFSPINVSFSLLFTKSQNFVESFLCRS